MKEKATFQDLNIGLHVVGKFLFKLETSEQIKWKILMKSTDQLLWELSNFYFAFQLNVTQPYLTIVNEKVKASIPWPILSNIQNKI